MARLTDYKEEHVQTIEKFTEEMNTGNFEQHCSVYHLAVKLDVCRDTIYEWKRQHEEFSYTIKKWEARRTALHFEKVGDYHPSIWIFRSKNWAKMSDKQEHKHEHELGDKAAKVIQQPIQFNICKLERPKPEQGE